MNISDLGYSHQIYSIKWRRNSDDIDSQDFYPELVLKNLAKNELERIPLRDYEFKFECSDQKYCIGKRDDSVLITCPHNTILEDQTRDKCRECDKEDYDVFMSFITGNAQTENAKAYLEEKQFLYLAFFQPATIKVGTANHNRKHFRSLEQDALIYTYIAEGNGYNIRELERAVSKELGLKESVNKAIKLKHIHEKPNSALAKGFLMSSYNSAFEKFGEQFDGVIYPAEKIEVFDWSQKDELYFPPQEFYKLNEISNLSGRFLGLRGSFLFFENFGEIVCLDHRILRGKLIKQTDKQHAYEPIRTTNTTEQISLF